MAGNVPNVSRTLYDFSKGYGPVVLQQGVPVHDADINETNDNLWIRGIHMVNHVTLGLGRFPRVDADGTPFADSGFLIKQATSTTNNFKITAGYACCYGVLVPNTYSMPPVDIDYEDQVMFTGTVSGVGGGAITDADKYFETTHDLVDCRVKMTSGAESGNTFTVTSRDSFTTLSLSGGTGSIATTDTYEIYPPALTTPSGGARTDSVYLMVWFDDINENEDTDIDDPGTGVEAVHKTKIRMVVRVNENSTSIPGTGVGALGTYAIRHMKLAELARLNGDATVVTAMITEEANILNSLQDLTSDEVGFDATAYNSYGYPPLSQGTIQEAFNNVIGVLDSNSSTLGSNFIGQEFINDTPDSIAPSTVHSAITNLLTYVNARVRNPHPDGTISAPTLIWRDHNITSDANVTADTASWYLLPQGTICDDSDGIGFIIGGYLSGANVTPAPVGSPTKMTLFTLSANGLKTYSMSSLSGSFAWDNPANWDDRFEFDEGGFSIVSSSLTQSVINLSADLDLYNDLHMNSGNIDLTSGSLIQPISSSGTTPIPIVNASGSPYDPQVHVMNEGYWITTNVNFTGGNWVPISNTEDATAVVFSYEGFKVYRKSHDTVGYASGWTLNNWDAKWTIGEQAADKGATEPYFYSGTYHEGNTYEELYYDIGGSHQFSAIADTLDINVRQGLGLKGRWASAPTTTSVAESSSTNRSSINALSATVWGVRISFNSTSIAATSGSLCNSLGTIKCYI